MKGKNANIESNYLLWKKRLERYGCYSLAMDEEMGQDIMLAPYTMDDSSGGAYEGGLLDVTMNVLCMIGYRINSMAFGTSVDGVPSFPLLHADPVSLMRVLLLQHVSKAQMFERQEESWKIKKGMMFQFRKDTASFLKMGERSIFLCMKYGIALSEEEFDAMRITDKETDMSNSFMSPLAQTVKAANQYAIMAIGRGWRKAKEEKDKNEPIEL